MKNSKQKPQTRNPPPRKLELLAPAGTLEVFESAVSNGADAVYVGAPFMNARALARNFGLTEIAAMADFAHSRDVKIYIAMNSLLKDIEVRELLKTLAALYDIKVDALIIQDIGILNLVKRYFPDFRVHASTLCTVHNSLGVEQYERMGVDRVVLAREMSIKEIAQVKKKTSVELELFVHGAMCFAYSGLCLFSSFLGGKSGLRGRCVQPCRRNYTWQGKGRGAKSGYLFSMNDLEGIDLVPQLFNAGVTSLKLEGRMRSSHYVGSVVKAYRMVLDAKGRDTAVIAHAKDILSKAMGRKSSSGYLKSIVNPNLISPHHSGNIGLFLGKIEKGGKSLATIRLREQIQTGDRFRIHLEKTGERNAFTLQNILLNGNTVNRARAGEKVEVGLPVWSQKGDSLYKVSPKEARRVDTRKSRIDPAQFRQKISSAKYKNIVSRILNDINSYCKATKPSSVKKTKFSYDRATKGRRSNQRNVFPLPWWLKIDDIRALKMLNGPHPDRLLVVVTKENIVQTTALIAIKRRHKKCIFALPPIIAESDVGFFAEGIKTLIQKGAKDWQIGQLGQLQFFSATKERAINIYGDFSLNVLNSLSVGKLRDLNITGTLLSMEIDKDSVAEICKRSKGIQLGITVYGTPPLFTARPQPNFFNFNQTFVSPRGEKFELKQKSGQTIAIPDKQLSLLPWLIELAEMGLDYFVVDLTNTKVTKGTIPAIIRKIGDKKRGERTSSFNYMGKLF